MATQATSAANSLSLAPEQVNGAGTQTVQTQQPQAQGPTGIAGNGQSTIASAQPTLSPEKEDRLASFERTIKEMKAKGDPQLPGLTEAVLFLIQKFNPDTIRELRGCLTSWSELSPAGQAQYLKMDPTFKPPVSFVPVSRYDGLEGSELQDAISQDIGMLMREDKARNPHLYGAAGDKNNGTDKKDDGKKA